MLVLLIISATKDRNWIGSLDGPGFELQRSNRFLFSGPFQTAFGAHLASSTMGTWTLFWG